MRLPPPLTSISALLLLAGCSACSTSRGPAAAAAPEGAAPADAAPEAPAPDSPPAAAAPDGELLAAELSTVGWDALSGAPVVLLRDLGSGRVLPIWIGLAEARAILHALHGVEPPRPQTHDLMARLLENLSARLEEVVVTELREGTYYGLLKLRVDGEETARWIDTRPSDGLALALRTGARIRVAAELVEDHPDFQFMAPEPGDQVVRLLGLTVRASTPELRAELGLPERAGLVVTEATGEAARRGLERGDLIVELAGETPREPVDLLDAIREAPGGVLRLTYWRDGKEKTVELEIASEPDSPEREEGQIA